MKVSYLTSKCLQRNIKASSAFFLTILSALWVLIALYIAHKGPVKPF